MSKGAVAAIAALIILPLGFGGYEILKNVAHVSFLAGPRGPDACKVLTPEIARSVLGRLGQPAGQQHPTYNETRCVWVTRAGRFVEVDVGSWSVIGVMAPSSGRSNEAAGVGTYLQNSAAGEEDTLASGSRVGHVARKGDIGLFVQAGNYGVFSGAAAVAELALEERLEQRLLPQLVPRL